MRGRQTLAALTVVAITALVLPAFAQTPGKPGNLPILPEQTPPLASKSDADRIVGKVLHIDRDAGLVKLDSDEGVVVVKPPEQLLRAVRVGETISVVRSVEAPSASSPSASPRTMPKR
ncbi:MAG TPA: hypothetical protein VGQ77_01355 [Methylomirabilota bacterium]|jgi:hypothetical protein|nr:hypothetical protein [Methylomirabilota bacterium]